MDDGLKHFLSECKAILESLRLLPWRENLTRIDSFVRGTNELLMRALGEAEVFISDDLRLAREVQKLVKDLNA